MRGWCTVSPEETRRLGRELAAELQPDGVLLLRGDLGSGKTVLAQGVASGLGIKVSEVQSPTFTIVREHQGPGGRFVHLDLYRLEPRDVTSAGIEELLFEPGVKLVEWSERLPFGLPDALHLEIVDRGSGKREISELVVGGDRAASPRRSRRAPGTIR